METVSIELKKVAEQIDLLPNFLKNRAKFELKIVETVTNESIYLHNQIDLAVKALGFKFVDDENGIAKYERPNLKEQ